MPILVETYRRPLQSYFDSQKYILPSLVEDVLTALAELFCLSEFIVSQRLVEATRRPSSSYFAWQNCSLHVVVEIVQSALAELFCLFD